VILLQVDLAFGDELETVYEGCYETENTSIFRWSSIPGIGHYCRLRGLIHRLPPNSKVDYLIPTTRRILDFLQSYLSLWHNPGLSMQLQLLIELIHNLNKCFIHYKTHVAIATLSPYLFNH
jgi:hypothetical protein